jgi:putative transposase
MVRFTQLRRSNIFSENACLILTGVLRYLGLDTSLRTSFEIGFSEALDPHVNRRRFTEVWWA